jgi:ABC-type multidrug transport system permease subunit
MTTLLLVRKDLLVLRRSPLLLGVLIAYPLVIAALISLTATFVNSKARVALVDQDHLPKTIVIGSHTFHVDRTIDEVAKNVKLVRLPAGEARRQLQTGSIVASLTIPRGFVADLKTGVHSPTLLLETTIGGITPRVRQQVQALVYELNRRLQKAFIEQDLIYVELLLHGGSGKVLDKQFHIIGLDGTDRILKQLPRGPRLDAIRDFVHDARLALALTGGAIRSTAQPIQLTQAPSRGRTWELSAQVQAYALALTITFLGLLLAAGALAAERDENVIGRLVRGLATPGQIVTAKMVLTAIVTALLGAAVALVFGVIIEAGNVIGGEPWARLPLLVGGLALVGAALGGLGAAIGTLAREARTASLVAILVVLPIVFLGLVPREIAPPAGWVSDAFPFAHAVRFVNSALYDTRPWGTLWHESAWLLGIAGVSGFAARLSVRRLAS